MTATRPSWRITTASITTDGEVDLAGRTQADFVEGTLYFLVRTDDLAARRFDGVVGVYQQT